jgi:hypothetical protein
MASQTFKKNKKTVQAHRMSQLKGSNSSNHELVFVEITYDNDDAVYCGFHLFRENGDYSMLSSSNLSKKVQFTLDSASRGLVFVSFNLPAEKLELTFGYFVTPFNPNENGIFPTVASPKGKTVENSEQTLYLNIQEFSWMLRPVAALFPEDSSGSSDSSNLSNKSRDTYYFFSHGTYKLFEIQVDDEDEKTDVEVWIFERV